MPGINVASTIERTVDAIPDGIVDEIFFVDDGCTDDSVAIAQRLGCTVVSHSRNLGYGAGQKTGYREALASGADVVVMVHPDYQYKPELVPAMASMVVHGGYDIVLGSRMLVRGAIAGGMPKALLLPDPKTATQIKELAALFDQAEAEAGEPGRRPARSGKKIR